MQYEKGNMWLEMSPYRTRRRCFFLRCHLKSHTYNSLLETEKDVVVSNEAAHGVIRYTAEMIERLRKNVVCLCSATGCHHFEQI